MIKRVFRAIVNFWLNLASLLSTAEPKSSLEKKVKALTMTQKSTKAVLLEVFIEKNAHIDAYQIHQVDAIVSLEQVVFKITLGKPNILIGKDGRSIKRLKKRLEEIFDKPVKLELFKLDIWD